MIEKVGGGLPLLVGLDDGGAVQSDWMRVLSCGASPAWYATAEMLLSWERKACKVLGYGTQSDIHNA